MAVRDPEDVFRIPGYFAFWSAYTVSGFGTYVTTLALQVLVLLTLHGTAADVGLLNAARWLPYLLLGVIVGALVDRRRRRPILIGTDLARAVLLGAIPILYIAGWLNTAVLIVFVAFFGVFSLFGDAASQSFLPRVVPKRSLLAAHARTDQSDAVAQTSGPLVAGGLVALAGAPLAVLVDAASYLFSALAISRIHVDETRQEGAGQSRGLRSEIAEGLRWVYRHRVLGPMAIGSHGWFLFISMLGTVFVSFALLDLHLSALQFGITLAAAGVTALVGSSYSTRVGLLWGRPGIIHHAVEGERRCQRLHRHRLRKQRVARHGTDALADPIQRAQHDDVPARRRDGDQRPRERRERVAAEDERLLLRGPQR